MVSAAASSACAASSSALQSPRCGAKEEAAHVTDARRIAVCLDGLFDFILEAADPVPVALQLAVLSAQGDAVHAVVRREVARPLRVLVREPPRLAQPAERRGGGESVLEHLDLVIGVRDLPGEVEPALCPGQSLLEVPRLEGGNRAGHPCPRPQFGVAHFLR